MKETIASIMKKSALSPSKHVLKETIASIMEKSSNKHNLKLTHQKSARKVRDKS